MLKRLFSLIRRFALCATFAVALAGSAPESPNLTAGFAAAAKQECVVYITRTGYRYHVGDCGYLRRSRIPVEKRKAIKAGYTPCKVCGGSGC